MLFTKVWNLSSTSCPHSQNVYLPCIKPWESREKIIRGSADSLVPKLGKNGVRNVITDQPQPAVRITRSAPNLSAIYPPNTWVTGYPQRKHANTRPCQQQYSSIYTILQKWFWFCLKQEDIAHCTGSRVNSLFVYNFYMAFYISFSHYSINDQIRAGHWLNHTSDNHPFKGATDDRILVWVCQLNWNSKYYGTLDFFVGWKHDSQSLNSRSWPNIHKTDIMYSTLKISDI